MVQFLADQIDQMDLALDQLAVGDRNFDRFAMMLIDNVVELTLHKHAETKDSENNLWRNLTPPRNDPKAVANALGQHFESKVKLAKLTTMIPPDVAESIVYLHSFRNSAYHRGLRHERILHSLAVFYFQNACTVLTNYEPSGWSQGSDDRISHRAIKYIGTPRHLRIPESFNLAWQRLREVGQTLGDTLISDLHADMALSIDETDKAIQFVTDDSPEKKARDEVIIDAQVWPFAFTDEGKKFAAEKGATGLTVQAHVDWLSKNYPWSIRGDPIPSWKERLESLENEENPHLGLKKYCDFMKQTDDIRSKVDDIARSLDNYIQLQIDIARGK